MQKEKIAIIGAGHVGATTAYLCSLQELGEVVLVDIVEGLAQGKALDIEQSLAVLQRDTTITGTTDISQIAGSRVVVITAGLARKPGMSRDDLVKVNGEIIRGIAEKVAASAPDAIIINVTNPMDAMTYLVQKVSQIPSHRVLGMGGVLDSGRFAAAIARKTNVSTSQIFALAIGMHGDLMVPLPRHSTIYGQPLPSVLSHDAIEDLISQTIHGGARIVKLLQTGSAYIAPAAAIVEMLRCILHDRKKILPCAAYLQGEYGQRDIYLGVPIRLGSHGLEKIVELELDPSEKTAFERSAESVRGMIQVLKNSSILPGQHLK
ncbi:MAG: malate dehydrogenase [bacterium]